MAEEALYRIEGRYSIGRWFAGIKSCGLDAAYLWWYEYSPKSVFIPSSAPWNGQKIECQRYIPCRTVFVESDETRIIGLPEGQKV